MTNTAWYCVERQDHAELGLVLHNAFQAMTTNGTTCANIGAITSGTYDKSTRVKISQRSANYDVCDLDAFYGGYLQKDIEKYGVDLG